MKRIQRKNSVSNFYFAHANGIKLDFYVKNECKPLYNQPYYMMQIIVYIMNFLYGILIALFKAKFLAAKKEMCVEKTLSPMEKSNKIRYSKRRSCLVIDGSYTYPS